VSCILGLANPAPAVFDEPISLLILFAGHLLRITSSQMRATNDRLSERFIVVVARELAKALKGLHEAGIMHRDVKGEDDLSA